MPLESQKFENSPEYYLIFFSICVLKNNHKLVRTSFMVENYIPNQHTSARPIVGLVKQLKSPQQTATSSGVKVVANGLAPGHVYEAEHLDS